MKKIMFVSFCFGFAFSLSAQINPLTNLTWDRRNVSPNNYFSMKWNAPVSQANLPGYNVYQGNQFYRFQADIFLYHDIPPTAPPCQTAPESFLCAAPLWAYFTVIYENNIKPTCAAPILVQGALIGINEIIYNKKPIFYPNPATGKPNIDYKNIQQIFIFGLNEKRITKFKTSSQIDLSDIPKELYFVKLISGGQSFASKLVWNKLDFKIIFST